jgi:hypothetical protein
MFCESYGLLKTMCQIWFFGHFLKKNFESRTLGSYRSQRIIHVRKISSHLLMY